MMTAPRTDFGMKQNVGIRKARARRITPPEVIRINSWFNYAFGKNQTVEKVSQLGLTTTGKEDGTSRERGCLWEAAKKGAKN